MLVPPDRRRSPWCVLVAVAAAVLASATPSQALWPSSSTGATAHVAARALPSPVTTATCTSASSASVAWTTSATAPVVTSFLVQRSATGGTWTTLATVIAVAGTTSYAVADGPLVEAVHTYRVTALNSSWSGPSGTSGSLTVLAAVTTGNPATRREASCTA